MLPKTRTSRARQRKRRSHHALRPAQRVVCPNCGTDKRPHAACGNCGYVRPGLMIHTSSEED